MKNSELKIVKIKENQIDELKLFIKKYYNKNHIFLRKPFLIDWFHKDDRYYNFYIAKLQNEIIGFQCFIRNSIFDRFLKNSKNETIFLADWKVKENQFPGIGVKLFKEIQDKEKVKNLCVINFNKKLINYHKWQGFNVSKMNHYVFISKHKKKYKIIKLNDFNISKLEFKIKDKITSEILDEKKVKNLNIKIFHYQIPLKSKNYLINKYLRCSFFKYFIYSINSENKKILIVFRKIKYKNSNILRIVDVIGNFNNFFNLYNFFNYIVTKYNSEFIEFYNYGLKKTMLSSCGFINREKTNIIAPSHFYPYENKNIDIYLGYKTKKKKLRLLLGDGDFERPSSF